MRARRREAKTLRELIRRLLHPPFYSTINVGITALCHLDIPLNSQKSPKQSRKKYTSAII